MKGKIIYSAFIYTLKNIVLNTDISSSKAGKKMVGLAHTSFIKSTVSYMIFSKENWKYSYITFPQDM